MVNLLNIIYPKLNYCSTITYTVHRGRGWGFINPWRTCTASVTVLGLCVCAFYSPITRYLSYKKTYFQGQRAIEKVLNLAFTLKRFVSKLWLFKLRYFVLVCVCYQVFTN